MADSKLETELLDQLFGSFKLRETENKEYGINKDSNTIDNSTSLYDILNSRKNSRQMMNKLFIQVERDDIEEDKILSFKCYNITEQWKKDALQTNSQINNSDSLQSDVPIKFSWSTKSKTVEEPINKDNKLSKDDASNELNMGNDSEELNKKDCHRPNSNRLDTLESKKETTNHKLHKIIFEELNKLRESSLTWEEILNDKVSSNHHDGSVCDEGKAKSPALRDLDDENVTNTTNFSSNKESTTTQNETIRPNFKVNPLEKFYPQELPKMKREPEVKHKKKRGSRLWFWGKKHKRKGTKHDKDKGKDKDLSIGIQPTFDDDNTAIDDIERYDKLHYNNISMSNVDDEFGEFREVDHNGTNQFVENVGGQMEMKSNADNNQTFDDLMSLPLSSNLDKPDKFSTFAGEQNLQNGNDSHTIKPVGNPVKTVNHFEPLKPMKK